MILRAGGWLLQAYASVILSSFVHGTMPTAQRDTLRWRFQSCTLLVTEDVLVNAISPGLVAYTLGIKALRTSRVVGYLGLVLLIIGLPLAALAIRQMGVSWRIGIDNQTPGPLVSRGIFSRVRHPIYGGMLLSTASFAAVTADLLLSVAVTPAVLVGLPVQASRRHSFYPGIPRSIPAT